MARRWPRSSRSRADDPIYEIGFRIVGSTEQERIWTHVLKSLAAHFGVNEPVMLEKVLVDPKVQWSRAKNVWHNAGIRVPRDGRSLAPDTKARQNPSPQNTGRTESEK